MVVQAALLVPSLLRSDLHVRFLWQPAHEAMRTITRLAGWTFGMVVANQVALVVVLALADGAACRGAVSAYTYAYTFFQLPYGVVAVSVMSAVTPSLSARWAHGNIVAFRHRMAFGLRSILAIVIPSAVGMIILAHPLIDLVLDHGAETPARRHHRGRTGHVLLGLPGFCTFLYMVRVLQSMQDTRTAFRIYLVENAINIVLGVALVGPLGVRGLALSVSVAYTAAALISLGVVARKDDGLGGQDLVVPVTRVLGSTAVMAVATVLAVNVSGATSGLALLGRVVFAVVVGAVAFVGATAVLGAREAKRAAGRRPRPPDDRTRTVAPPVPPDPDTDDPRGRAGRPSIRLIAPATAGTGEHGSVDDRGDPEAGNSTDPFRGRLGGQPDSAPVRHLRPVQGGRQDTSRGHGRNPGHRRTFGGGAGGHAAPRRRGVAPWLVSGW